MPLCCRSFGAVIGRLVAIFWLLGSALVAANVPRSAFVCTPARINTLNSLTSREVPGYLQVLGSANSNATATLWSAAGPLATPAGHFAQTLRHGEHFAGELVPNNTTGAVWLVIANLAVRQQGTNADIATTNIGSAFVAQTPEVLGHDADGNLTNDGRWIFTWDAENRLTKIESRASAPTASKRRLEFTYDAEWRRIQKIVYTNNGSGYVAQYTNRFVYDGWKLLAVLDGGNNLLQSFVWGTDLSGSLHGVGGVGGLLAVTDYRSGTAGTYFAAYDGNGNVVALVRAADGSAAARYEYGPFGEFLRATGPMAKANPLRWSTKYQDDETGLVYYGWRYYSPSLGRWISRDPLGEAGGLNLYAAMRSERQPIAWQVPPILNWYRSSFLEFTALQRGRCAVSCIHPNAPSHGPPTSRPVQVNLAGNPLARGDVVGAAGNRVRGATASALSPAMLYQA